MQADINTHPSINHTASSLLESLWVHGVESVRGRASVKRYFKQHKPVDGDYTVIAIGKAATDMMLGAMDALGDRLSSGLVLTKHHHLVPELTEQSHIVCHESSHPVPDESSLEAGRMLLDFIATIPDDKQVLALISGGASSLVEVLVDGCTLKELQTASEWALQSGLNINEINYMRQRISLIKGGKLCSHFAQENINCLYISDVPNDNMNVIGSGLLYSDQDLSTLISAEIKQSIDNFLKQLLPSVDLNPANSHSPAHFDHCIVANNTIARDAVKEQAEAMEYPATIIETPIDMDYQDAAEMIFTQLKSASPGVYIWGGEPTVELPENPGSGGRNQALALLLSRKLASEANHISVLVAGTDGTDGPTDAAGATVDQDTEAKAKEQGMDTLKVLAEANAYPCLKDLGCLFSPGPTGTNVMDLVVAVVDKP